MDRDEPSRLHSYALDRKKTSPDGLEQSYGIERVPTFIFLRGGKEIGTDRGIAPNDAGRGYPADSGWKGIISRDFH